MTKISKKAVKKLASGSVKENKGKYSVMIFSIILTTVLFSSLFTIVGSLLSEFSQSSMGQYNYMDPVAMLVCAAAVVIFMFSGYLIIYNIFDLNIVSDMKEYGLLKSIGTTGKQIRKMMNYRTKHICLVAIPIGLVIGCGIGGWMLPMIGKFINTVGILGLLDIITAVNDDGVMIAILDVGSKEELPFVYNDKKCYTFEIRYALEHFHNAKEAGEYLLGESGDFTWCNNLLCTDEKDAFCCENTTKEVAATGKARSVLRTTESELMEGLAWDSPDALCIVNSFATKGNQDGFTVEEFNITRFVKYNKWVKEKDKFSIADAKGLVAREVVDQFVVSNVHNSGNVHTVIVDYATGKIHVAFTKGDHADDIPVFWEVGTY